MFDLVISNGTAVLPSGTAVVDIAVTNGIIAAIGGPGTLAAVGATRVVDATGQIVVPGGIDPHIHSGLTLPGPGGTTMTSELPEVVSKACLFGGTTMMCDFIFWKPGESLTAAAETRRKLFDDVCYADYTLHIAVESPMSAGYPGRDSRHGAGRLSDHQDVHDGHHPGSHGASDALRRYLGGSANPRERRRHGADPCRG